MCLGASWVRMYHGAGEGRQWHSACLSGLARRTMAHHLSQAFAFVFLVGGLCLVLLEGYCFGHSKATSLQLGQA